MAIKYVRTPDENFENLPGWDYAPKYINDLPGYEGLRLHYVDEGPKDGITFLCLHGEPTWSYLYRKMAPIFLEAGHRFVAPDFFGFGRSDKPVEKAVYTYNFFRNNIVAFVEKLDLKNVCLVVQDWGGIIGLTLPLESPERYTRLLIMNTILPTGGVPSDGFTRWRKFCRTKPDINIADLLDKDMYSITKEEMEDLLHKQEKGIPVETYRMGTPILSKEEAQAYAAPFVDKSFKAGFKRFPELVMFSEDGVLNPLSKEGIPYSIKARKFWSEEWNGDSFMAIGVMDKVLIPPFQYELQQLIKGCPEPMLVGTGHFVQEKGEEVAKAALKHFEIA